MMLWKQLRTPLLAVTFGGVLFVLGKLILVPPTVRDATATPFVFPPDVPLPGWRLETSRPLARPKEAEALNLMAGRHYQYSQNGLPLEIEMRYLLDSSGEVKGFIQEYTSLSVSATLRQQEGIGFYGLLVHQQRAYLSACINPRGYSTFTNRQFRQNGLLYDVRLGRLLPWFLGQQKLIDQRCLWAYLSVPLADASPKAAYQVLETAWFSWYEWWQPRFPKL